MNIEISFGYEHIRTRDYFLKMMDVTDPNSNSNKVKSGYTKLRLWPTNFSLFRGEEYLKRFFLFPPFLLKSRQRQMGKWVLITNNDCDETSRVVTIVTQQMSS